MVSKEEHLDRVIAWLNEIATVAHNNTSRRLALNEKINYKLSLRDLDDKNDLGEVEKRTKEKTEQTAQRVNYSVFETEAKRKLVSG